MGKQVIWKEKQNFMELYIQKENIFLWNYKFIAQLKTILAKSEIHILQINYGDCNFIHLCTQQTLAASSKGRDDFGFLEMFRFII